MECEPLWNIFVMAVIVKAVGIHLQETAHFEHLDVDSRIILKWIFNKYVRRVWTGFI
jgi:hypothetical protein